jgi:hypothetical protein
VAAADNNLLSLSDSSLQSRTMLRRSLYTSLHWSGENMARQIFSFLFRIPR